jgi:carbonic anhydrase
LVSRRCFCCATVGVAAVSVMPTLAFAAVDECLPFDAALQKATTPDQAIAFLVEGNARFIAGKPLNCAELPLLKAEEKKQTPFACVLGCIDSRTSPELVFDQQVGDIFTARVAGNVATTEIIGSFEYAAKVAGAKAIMVLGHSHCGAVKGAIDKAKVGDNLTVLLDSIEPVVASVPLKGGERTSKNEELVEEVAIANVKAAVAKLTEASPVLKELVAAGTLKIVGAMEDIGTGKITIVT